MAEIAGLALAANIMQFVELGGKTLHQLQQYYVTGRHSNDLIPDIKVITANLADCLSRIEGNKSVPTAAGDQLLQELAHGCRQVALELQSKLAAINPTNKIRRGAGSKALKLFGPKTTSGGFASDLTATAVK